MESSSCTDPNVDSRRGPHAQFWIARLGRLSTFPWGRMTDTREKESPFIILRSEGRWRISYPGLGFIEPWRLNPCVNQNWEFLALLFFGQSLDQFD
ncbi:hypothetical protein CRG98_021775 [Punica granatum]|uniref:Uncharacterized protein n=1 Tax=Punica granatum TaxID=22663 RepID=A0A2I0JNI9_PUNGR|nr:hypothetical protein CRG98_021775 [Punica granatum]